MIKAAPTAALMSAVAFLTLPALADMPCHALVDRARYCSDADLGPTFISQVIYPDILYNFTLSEEPLVTSKIIAMPYDRPITDWSDIEDMVFDQVMFRGSARFHTIDDIRVSPGLVDGENSIQLEYVGYNSDGGVMAVSIVDALPMMRHVLMIITTNEQIDTVTPGLRAHHAASIASITGIGQ